MSNLNHSFLFLWVSGIGADSGDWVKKKDIQLPRGDATDIKFGPRELHFELAVSSEVGFIRIYEAYDMLDLTKWCLTGEIRCKLKKLSCLSWSLQGKIRKKKDELVDLSS